MEIKLEDNTIGYSQFLKLFAVGWTLGLGSVFAVFGVFGFIANAVLGDWSQATEALLVVFLGPLILLMQSPVFGSFAYLGVVVFRRFRKLEFTNGT